jgi:hypothetical protein
MLQPTTEKSRMPNQRPQKPDLDIGQAFDFQARDVRGQYDSDTVAALFEASGWSDFQMFVLAFAIAIEFEGPNSVREIQKLSRADALWARHLATSEPQRGGAQ